MNNKLRFAGSFAGAVKVKLTGSASNAESGIIPAAADDICNYVAKYDMANFQIQAVMKLDGKLEFDKLDKAVRLSVDVEPIFGCHFVKSSKPYWKPFEDLDKVEFCSMDETEDPYTAVQGFLESYMDMDKDPVVKLKLIRSGKNDTLCFKINHACCDAAGARDYIDLVSDIYTRISRWDDEFAPKPSKRDKKDRIRLVKALCKSKEPSWGPHKQSATATWSFPWKNYKKGATRFVSCSLPAEHLGVMKSFGKARGATINDLILTAIYRAMFDISKPPYGLPMDIPLTIDLRKYLPGSKAEAIRNMSGGFVVKMARNAGESFEDTLSRVVNLTEEIRNKRPSIKNFLWAECIEQMNFRQLCSFFKAESKLLDTLSTNKFFAVKKCCPILSNFGFISRSFIRFGENTVTDAYIIPPVVRAPGILLVASTYNNVITFAAGYYEPSVNRSDMELLINKIKDELMEGCSN